MKFKEWDRVYMNKEKFNVYGYKKGGGRVTIGNNISFLHIDEDKLKLIITIQAILA